MSLHIAPCLGCMHLLVPDMQHCCLSPIAGGYCGLNTTLFNTRTQAPRIG